jgi:hypothetical protein
MTKLQFMEEESTLIEKAVDQLIEEYPPAKTDAVNFRWAPFEAGLAYVWVQSGMANSVSLWTFRPTSTGAFRPGGPPLSCLADHTALATAAD